LKTMESKSMKMGQMNLRFIQIRMEM